MDKTNPPGPSSQVSVRRLMIGIALCAVALTALREASLLAILTFGPLVGALWEVRKGGKGILGGMLGGAIAWGGFGLLSLLDSYFLRQAPPDPILAPVVWTLMTLGGASLGLVVGCVVWFLRDLTTLPQNLRLRAQRSAQANSYRPGSGTEKPRIATPSPFMTERQESH